VTMTATAATVEVTDNQSTAKLVRPRDTALVHLQNQLRRGTEIMALRIRSGNELDRARATKLEWTSRTIELLNELFDSPRVAEECNDWVGKIYPEYAEFGNFVEQFYAEMDHRLRRLKAVIKRIEKEPTDGKIVIPSGNGSAAAVAEADDAAAQAPAPAAESAGSVVPHELAGLLVTCKADDATKQSVVDFFESLDIEVALGDDTSGMAEALDRQAKVSFAVILSAGDVPADHNFELGFCAGRLGLKRVFLLHPQPTSAPDAHGLTHVVLDTGGGWQLQLARHLKRAGLGVDLNRLC
jgi:hypothetical protein